MKSSYLYLTFFILLSVQCTSDKEVKEKPVSSKIPSHLMGFFEDDYQIQYSVSDTVFKMIPNSMYHIKKWNIDEQYLIAQNDSSNSYDPNLWTRIDWIDLENMSPFNWAFCLSVYNAKTFEEAELGGLIDPETPLTGCNGFPFSRMSPIETVKSDTTPY